MSGACAGTSGATYAWQHHAGACLQHVSFGCATVHLLQIADVMEMVQEKELFPIIVFSFNRIECEQFAMNLLQRGKKLGGKLDFTTADEKAAIDLVRPRRLKALCVHLCVFGAICF